MSRKVKGNTRSLPPSIIRNIERLYNRRVDASELVPPAVARELWEVAHAASRRVGLLISREGRIEEVFIGNREILYLPDIGRYRLSAGRLRRLRLIFSDLSKGDTAATIPSDIITDLQKLRLDAVVGIKPSKGRITAEVGYLSLSPNGYEKLSLPNILAEQIDFEELIASVEDELSSEAISANAIRGGAMLVHVSEQNNKEIEQSLDELEELARTAGVAIVDRIIQRKAPDPRSVLGKGKLEEVVLQALKSGAELLIFDCELKPGQWKNITTSTELKVLDRSMLILDIFAQRASTSEGALQVELAQLKYNLPRLVEKDAGLSRLTGGIGGRGPGETKLEIGRRRTRERITILEKKISTLQKQRATQKSRRRESGIPLVAVVGYTNVGKSTLFNALTGASSLAENKLFATLHPFQRRLVIPSSNEDPLTEMVLSDTVGFIRDLPDELTSAFRATLEELHDASVIVHVVDISDSNYESQKKAVENILSEMGIVSVPTIVVFNKVDRLKDDFHDDEGIPISALQKKGFGLLLETLKDEIKKLSATKSMD